MKYFLITILYLVVSVTFAQESTKTEIMFNKKIYNFGKIKYGNEVSYQFEFKNIGKNPLIIQNIETSCGCTVAQKPDYPVKPKQKDYITVVYNADEIGKFQKSIKIFSNSKYSPYTIYIKGEVIKN